MKKIIKDSKSNLYWFDGRRMEKIGTADEIINLWRKVIFRIGSDVYAYENGEYRLLSERAEFFLLPTYKRSWRYKEKGFMQFKLLSGVLAFQESPEKEPVYLSQKLMDSWGAKLTATAPDKQRIFAVWRFDKADAYRTAVYTIDKDNKVQKLPGEMFCLPTEYTLFWNGSCYEGIDRKVDICPWQLLHKTDSYMVLSACGSIFALLADGTYRYLGYCTSIDIFKNLVRTPRACILATKEKRWRLGDDSIEEIGK